MFESHFSHHFFRLWGVKEGASGMNADTVLLGNAQNAFDAMFGDVAAMAGSRFFIVEFKLKRSGITTEVAGGTAGKTHRYHLFDHLLQDERCREISQFGHFAAYPDASNRMTFEPYSRAVDPVTTRARIKQLKLVAYAKQTHPMERRSFVMQFDEFYGNLTKADDRFGLQHPEFFLEGFGLPMPLFREYIACMYQHLGPGSGDDGTAIVGATNPATKKFEAFAGTVHGLLTRLHQDFQRLAGTMQPVAPPGVAKPGGTKP